MKAQTYLLTALLYACSSSDSSAPEETDERQEEDETGERDAGRLDSGRMDSGRSALDANTPSASDAGDSGLQSSNDGGGSDSAVDAATQDAFAMCVAKLKKPCKYDEKETACASLTTPEIPLTSGEKWGNKEIPGGPYGAIVDWNQGMAFENPENLLEGTCAVLAGTFGEPAEVTADILDLRGADLGLYTVFRPACMHEGEKFPVITWGNGTCGQTGGYASQLAILASHGFVVFAPNSRFTNQGNNEMLRALDFAKAANADSKSPLYQRLDLDKVGAMGHSQGASATAAAARDPRVKAIILWNGASSGQPAKPFLSVTGERDINNPTVMSLSSFVNQATQPGAWMYYNQVLQTGGNVTGHLTLMEQPERVTDVTIGWWKFQLKGDAEAKRMFVGADCQFCREKTAYTYGVNSKLN